MSIIRRKRIQINNMTHSNVHAYTITHSNTQHDTFKCSCIHYYAIKYPTWHIQMFIHTLLRNQIPNMTHSNVHAYTITQSNTQHDTFKCLFIHYYAIKYTTWLIQMFMHTPLRIQIHNMTHSNVHAYTITHSNTQHYTFKCSCIHYYALKYTTWHIQMFMHTL